MIINYKIFRVTFCKDIYLFYICKELIKIKTMKYLLAIVWGITYACFLASSVYFGIIKEDYTQGIYLLIWALLIYITGYNGLKDQE